MFLDLLLIVIIKGFQQSIRVLPEKAQQFTGKLLGRMAFRMLKTRRQVALSNIHRVFKHYNATEANELAKKCFENLGTNFVEILLLPYVSKDEYHERFSVENREYMDQALERGKGVLALIFHYGNWEIMGVIGYSFETPVIALARPLKKHKLLNKFANSLRASARLTIIPNADTSKEVFRRLKGNNIIAILSDQREKRSRGVYVDFFGEPVPTSKGIAAIAMKTGAPAVPCYCVRKGFLRYVIRIEKPLDMERKGDISDLIRVNTRKVNAFLESIILEHPDEWFWVHQRWGRARRSKRRRVSMNRS